MSIPTVGFEVDPISFLRGASRDQAESDLESYLDSFTGSRFERMTEPHSDSIGVGDLLALKLLSVDPPPHFIVWVLEDGSSAITKLLRAVDEALNGVVDRPIWEADAELLRDPTKPLIELRILLQSQDAQWMRSEHGNKVGFTKATKLLAAKRPNLVPIYDSIVSQGLQYPSDGTYWERWRTALVRDGVVEEVTELREAVAARQPSASHLSVLRVLDIVIWRAAKRIH